MELLMLTSLLVTGACAFPQGYRLPLPESGTSLDIRGVGQASSDFGFRHQGSAGGDCVDGSCPVEREVTTNYFVYRTPATAPIVAPRPAIPPQRVENNVVLIHVPENLLNQEPIVVPPPQQRNVVYVLNKRPHHNHNVINLPPPEQPAPEIYFVNYAEGENPTLPSGGDLNTALRAASESNGQIIGQTAEDLSLITDTGAFAGVADFETTGILPVAQRGDTSFSNGGLLQPSTLYGAP